MQYFREGLQHRDNTETAFGYYGKTKLHYSFSVFNIFLPDSETVFVNESEVLLPVFAFFREIEIDQFPGLWQHTSAASNRIRRGRLFAMRLRASAIPTVRKGSKSGFVESCLFYAHKVCEFF